MLRHKFVIGLISVAILFAIGCGDPIPIKELSSARQAITKALSVRADKYAPEEIEKAKNKLIESHSFVIKEKMDDAKKSALESYKLAMAAYNKSIPLLAKDTIDTAEKSLEFAREAYAENLAKSEFSTADKSLNEANTLFQNKKYYDSYIKALEADRNAKNARNVALSKRDTLKDAIAEVRNTLENARKYGADKYAAEKLSLAESNLNIASEAYNEDKLKKGFSAVQIAKINANEAYLQSLSETAKFKIADSDVSLDNAGKSEGAAVAVDEFEAAKESQKNAKSMYAEGRYKEAIDYTEEAKRLSLLVASTKKPDIVANRDNNDNKEVKVVKKGYFWYRVKLKEQYKDCLWRIASKYYKNPKNWKKIYNANKKRISNPDLIRPGWRLKVPILSKKHMK